MNNAELNAFAYVPANQTLKRSIFDLSHSNKLTARVGDMIPFECLEIEAGDTIKLNQNQLLRSITPANPTMDNAYVDFFYFFVPNRICMPSAKFKLDEKIWEQINGENTKSYWANTDEVEATTVKIGEIEAQSACDYLGMPIGDYTECEEEFNPAMVIAYGLIWNEFFRDQNIQAPIVDWEQFIKDAKKDCLHVSKFHDYFTSALPAPQKGDDVKIGLAGYAPLNGYAPIRVGDEAGFIDEIDGESTAILGTVNIDAGSGITRRALEIKQVNHLNKGHRTIEIYNPTGSSTAYTSFTGDLAAGKKEIYHHADLREAYADLEQASSIPINDLRLAFATQKMLERDARSGTRYIEMLKARWNITIKDETLQRPQYIGGKRIPLNITQVNQTSEGTENSPLGRSGAFSLTTGQNISFTASFKEAGYLIGIMCIRLSNSYKMGLPIMFSRKNRLDWYNPEFANIGEQSIKNKELRLDPKDKTLNNQTFGYKEAWAEKRYEQNKLKGKFKDPNELLLATWTYAQEFADTPTLNENFMKQSREPFLKTLAVQESDYDYIVDIYESISASRPLPTYSIPSLIDHN